MRCLHAQQSDAFGWVLTVTKILDKMSVTLQLFRVSKRNSPFGDIVVG
jgi:hypothetical protein